MKSYIDNVCHSDSVHEDSNTSMDSLLFDLKTLKAATKNFSDEYKLGQGGFGPATRYCYVDCTW